MELQASSLMVGFIGLGSMGSGMVKSLLRSGHNVVIWDDCSPNKYQALVEAGVEVGQTPSDVVLASDVTFTCLEDPGIAMEVVLGTGGVLQELTGAKGYIQLTDLEPHDSRMIAQAIRDNGGRYLEAPFQGRRAQADEGTLVFLAAGDRSLYNDCRTCFQAMGNLSRYVGEVGVAIQVFNIFQQQAEAEVSAFIHSLRLSEALGLSLEDYLQFLESMNNILTIPFDREMIRIVVDGDISARSLPHLLRRNM